MGRLRRFLPPQVADLIVASRTEKQLEYHRRENPDQVVSVDAFGYLGGLLPHSSVTCAVSQGLPKARTQKT
jgi:hypothetical protein